MDIACNGHSLGKYHGNLCYCLSIDCSDCDFGPDSDCSEKILEWANSEYVEHEIDWTKVPVDTPVYVRDYENESWKKRYFAEYRNGKIYVYPCGATSWSFDPDNTELSKWEEVKIAEDVDCSEWYKD